MSTPHTPGEWVARQQFKNRWQILVPREGFVPLSIAIVTTTVCEVGYGDRHTEANAHLIAAAPALLAACERVLAHAKRHSLDGIITTLETAIATTAPPDGAS